MKIEVSIDESPKDVLTILREVGAEEIHEVKQRGMTGAEIIILGILLANALANLVIRLSRLWSCGVLVDGRASRVLVTKNRNLPNGTVLVIAPDGTETKLHEPAELDLKPLISSFSSSEPSD